jgi:hypothetical protein
MTVCQVEGSRAPILRPPLLVAPMPLAGGLQTAEPKVDAGFVPSRVFSIRYQRDGALVQSVDPRLPIRVQVEHELLEPRRGPPDP